MAQLAAVLPALAGAGRTLLPMLGRAAPMLGTLAGGKGGGGKKGGGASEGLERGLENLLQQQQAIFRTQQPVRREFSGQLLEALRTGGVGARIPIAQRGVEATRAGTARALRATEGQLGSLAGTPFGQQILAQQRQQGAVAASQIPGQIAQQLMAEAPGFLGTAGGQALGALGGFPGALSDLEIAQREQRAKTGAAFGSQFQQLMRGKGGGGGGKAGKQGQGKGKKPQ